MKPSNVQELKELEEIDHKTFTEDTNDTWGSSLDMILKSLFKISVFKEQFHSCPQSIEYREELLVLSFIENLKLRQPQEANNVFDLFVYILENFSPWKPYCEVYESSKKICNRCKTETEYQTELSYGLFINANSLRETKALSKNFTFEKIIKIIRIYLKMPCGKEGCGKQSYVQRMIKKLPTVFTIALEWEYNETEAEILDTTSVLKTEIDLSEIYQYEGDNTKYRLVSMVCSRRDRYNCVAYEEERRWVRYLGYKNEVIGDWDRVLSIFQKLQIRPEILVFEHVMQKDETISEDQDIKA